MVVKKTLVQFFIGLLVWFALLFSLGISYQKTNWRHWIQLASLFLLLVMTIVVMFWLKRFRGLIILRIFAEILLFLFGLVIVLNISENQLVRLIKYVRVFWLQ